MKKVMYVLLLAQSTFLMAQVKTVVTVNGEKVTINTGVDNGISATSGKIQLGGALTKPTTITTDATNTLEINSGGTSTAPVSAIKLVDGNQAKGKVLTSDANGVATWELKGMSIVKGVVPGSSVSYTPVVFGNDQFYTGCYIDLPPGNWRLEFGSWITGTGTAGPIGEFASIFFSNSSTAIQQPAPISGLNVRSVIIPDLYSVKSSNGLEKYGTGSVFINIPAPVSPAPLSTVRIHMWAFFSVIGFTNPQPAGAMPNSNTFLLTSRNGEIGGFGPYTYLVATSID